MQRIFSWASPCPSLNSGIPSPNIFSPFVNFHFSIYCKPNGRHKARRLFAVALNAVVGSQFMFSIPICEKTYKPDAKKESKRGRLYIMRLCNISQINNGCRYNCKCPFRYSSSNASASRPTMSYPMTSTSETIR